MEKRDINNYPHKSRDIEDIFSGNINEYKCVPMRFNLNNGTGSLFVEAWKSADDFNSRAQSSPALSKSLPITADVVKNYSELFQMIEVSSLNFLEVSDTDFSLERIEISLTELKIRVGAKHKSKVNRIVSDETNDWQEFELVKSQYPALVGGFIQFAFDYMASNEQLAKFK